MVPIDQIISIDSAATPEDFDEAVRKTGLSDSLSGYIECTLIGYLHKRPMSNERYRAPIPINRVRSMVNITVDKPIDDA